MTRRQFSIAALASTSLLRAETPPERAKRVLAKTIAALGGPSFQNMQTRVEAGRAYSFYREEVTGLSTARIETKYLKANPQSKAPEVFQVQRQVYGKKDDEKVLLSATDAWDLTYRGAARMPKDRVDQFRETTLHDCLYILRQRVDEPGSGFDSLGADVMENQPVETLRFFDSEDRKVTIWIHSSTFLPIKQSYRLWDATIKDQRNYITRYTKYRPAPGGITWPLDIQRERDGDKIFELFSDRVTANEPLADSLFELPPGIKIWKK